jgi:hypothetical protein
LDHARAKKGKNGAVFWSASRQDSAGKTGLRLDFYEQVNEEKSRVRKSLKYFNDNILNSNRKVIQRGDEGPVGERWLRPPGKVATE